MSSKTKDEKDSIDKQLKRVISVPRVTSEDNSLNNPLNCSSSKSQLLNCCSTTQLKRRKSFKSIFSNSLIMIIITLLVNSLLLLTNYNVNCHPVSSLHMCHGLQQGTKYTYNYHTLMLLNNHDHKGKEPVGFGFSGKFSLENVYENQESFLLKISFASSSDGGHFVTRNGEQRGGLSHSKISSKKSKDLAKDDKQVDKYPMYALIEDKKEEQIIKSFYIHNQEDLITRTNLKKTIVLLTRSKPGDANNLDANKDATKIDTNNRIIFKRNGQEIHKSYHWSNVNNEEEESILLPEMINTWSSFAQLSRDHSIITNANGWQNVTLRSRIYNEAYSKLHLTYKLELAEEESSSDGSFQSANSLSSAIKEFLGENYIQQDVANDETCPRGSCPSTKACPSGLCSNVLTREKQVCHECRTLAAIVTEYEDFMSDNTAASVQSGIAYLKIMDRVRSGGPGTSKEDMIKILNKYFKKDRLELVSSLLDIFAGARTESSIEASFEFLNLPNNDDLDICERFLTTLASSCSTGSRQSLSDPISSVPSHEFVVEDVLRLLQRTNNWSSNKVKWSTILALGSLLKSHNLMRRRSPNTSSFSTLDKKKNEYAKELSNEIDVDAKVSKDADNSRDADELTIQVINYISKELESCKDADCKVAILHALGNAGHLSVSISVLEKYALDASGKRESIAAMKAIKDCLEDEGQVNDSKLIYRLRILVLKIVYDSNHESTSRIIAAEIIAKYLADEVLSAQLLQQLPGFGNNEMVTLMWKRALMLSSSKEGSQKGVLNNNWLIQSTLFNGTSSAFTRNIGGTNTMNATYGVAMELLSGKLLKESSFDFLLGNQKNQQHILSVGLFARGLSSFAGSSSSDGGSDDSDESTMAGMALKIMGMQLRPYKFFASTTELMGHVWSGTASEPTTAYRGNLLMADHEDGMFLINGFILEQRLRGVLNLDLSGEIQISLWNRNSHAVVRSKAAALMQGSQAIVTSDPLTSASQLFAFGGSTSIDTTTDTDFYTTPFKMCVKMTQPEFMLRHNTRKFEQVNDVNQHKRIHRRNYLFPAKSYALHPKIQEVCQKLVTNDGDD